MAAKNQELIRDMNYHEVLENIINEGTTSRASLAKKLGLTKATISSQVQSLMDDGLIIEVGSAETTKGRRPILLKFNVLYGHVISVDIGLSTINLLLSDMLGRHCFSKQYMWDGRNLTDVLLLAIGNMIEAAPESMQGIIGICLGIHGVVHKNKILFTPYYELNKLPLKKMLEGRFSIPVFLENEANLSALGEKTFSFQVSNMINISVHSGIGLGVIVNNQLYCGMNGSAGEFGHTIVEPDGILCPCGNSGCIEQYASEIAILRKYSLLKNAGNLTIDDLVSDYQHGKEAARSAVQDFIHYMSIGVNNIVNIFNPELIVINSSFTTYLPDVIGEIQKLLPNRMSQQCKIVRSMLQDTATLLGGVHICSRDFLKIDTFAPPLA
ncbi:ROK family transcriptional regulator [Lachnospiraceae bacterium ZAX-1]